jgi:6,7-dimethyl-8-ribityllumazine synthase
MSTDTSTTTQVLHGSLAGGRRRFAIAVARFNEEITLRLLAGALACFRRHGVAAEDVLVVWVPGSFELPWAALRLARSGAFDAVVCLGAVIRGETPHFDHVCAETARGIAAVARATGVPVLFGVLTCDTVEQAADRAGDAGGNKGAEAASAALEMASLADLLPQGSRAASPPGPPALEDPHLRP